MTRRSSGLLAALLLAGLPSAAAGQDRPGRDPGRIVYIGDSRLAAQFEDPNSQRIATARFFGNVAAQRLDQRLETEANLSASGFRSDEYLTDEAVARAIATRAQWVVVFGIVNDVARKGAADYFGGTAGGLREGIRGQVDKLRAAGMRPILVLEPGSTAVAADPSSRASFDAYNAAVRAYAAEHPDVVVFDMPAVMDVPGRKVEFRPGYARDGTHLDTLGGFAVGVAFADLMRPLIGDAPPPGAMRPGADNLVPNGRFVQAAGGSAAEGTQGEVPATYVARCTPGLTAKVSTTPAGAGGNAVVLDVEATTAGTCSLGYDLTGETEGQAYEEFVRAEVLPGATGLAGPYLQLQSNRNGQSLDAFDNFWSTSGPGPSDGRVQALRTPPLVVPAGTRGWFTTRLGAAFVEPGHAVVRFSDHSVVPAAAR